jgi:hypothetical protein
VGEDTVTVFIKTKDYRQCKDVLPVRSNVGSTIVVEHRCVLRVGHEGMHRDHYGSCWVNQHDILRQRGAFEIDYP